jgi:5-methylcytosine-specific restriction endonuclease McrA
MTHKKCTKCQLELELKFFQKDASKKHGRKSRCLDCTNKGLRAYRSLNPEKCARSQSSERLNRINSGLCRYCKSPRIEGHSTLCKKHYVTNVAQHSLGRCDLETVGILISRFEENPVCPYTGEALILGTNAHLDHIVSRKNDPSLSTDINNVEWISDKVNIAKNEMNKDDFIQFCKSIAVRF